MIIGIAAHAVWSMECEKKLIYFLTQVNLCSIILVIEQRGRTPQGETKWKSTDTQKNNTLN